jgi:hypothetical protein
MAPTLAAREETSGGRGAADGANPQKVVNVETVRRTTVP